MPSNNFAGFYMRGMSSEAEEMRPKLPREGSLIFDVKVIARSQSGKVE